MTSATSLVRSAAPPSPVQPFVLPGREPVLLKREDAGPNGTFKWRGALTALDAYRRDGADAVVTASTGNHGAAVAWAAKRLGMTAHVFLPVGANPTKVMLIAGHDATLHEEGPDLDAASAAAVAFAGESGIPYFEDGGSAAQLLGTSTVGDEIAELDDVGAVFTPVACGALAGGVATALRQLPSPPRIVGVQSLHFSRMTARFHDRPYVSDGQPTFADGLADNRIVEPAFTACMELLDELIAVDEEQLRDAVRQLWQHGGLVAEGAGAAALAGLLSREWPPVTGRTVVIVSGRNLDPALARELLGPDVAP